MFHDILNIILKKVRGAVEEKVAEMVSPVTNSGSDLLVRRHEVEDLLRRLMFIENVTGKFGQEFDKAILALKYELNSNKKLEKFRTTQDKIVEDTSLTEEVYQALKSMEADSSVAKLVRVDDYLEQNKKIEEFAKKVVTTGSEFPTVLALAILKHESNFRWYKPDGYVSVNLDYGNKKVPYSVTSRGFFISQRTITGYPIAPSFLKDNNRVDKDMAFFKSILYNKFMLYVVSSNPKMRDDVRMRYHMGPLRGCIYTSSDARYKRDCVNCVKNIPKRDYESGYHIANNWFLKPTQYHLSESYKDAPDVAQFPCDYLYAIRRYNGSGVSSFHYLLRVLMKIG